MVVLQQAPKQTSRKQAAKSKTSGQTVASRTGEVTPATPEESLQSEVEPGRTTPSQTDNAVPIRRVARAQSEQGSLERAAERKKPLPVSVSGRQRTGAQPKATGHLRNPRSDVRFQQLNAKFQPLAQQGLHGFIKEIVEQSVQVAQEFANTALMYGLAASAIAEPVMDNSGEAIEWLQLQDCQELANWVNANQAQIADMNVPFGVLAASLQTYIDGGRQQHRHAGVDVTDSHARAAEEVVRLLRSLNVSQTFEQQLIAAPALQHLVLDTFRQELDKIAKQQLPNYSMFNYTLQEISAQTLNLLHYNLHHQQWPGNALALQQVINQQIRELSNTGQNVIVFIPPNHASEVNIYQVGGAYVGGDVNTGGGNLAMRDMITHGCPPA